ncbi:MAG: cyclic nucleotide-binding domain-containing protein, partial [Leptospirales bacterium]|nr:cyclic nucleotide-binding domain-containing protein [Leptospirales bacterium]
MTTGQFKIESYIADSFIIIEGKKNSNCFYIIRSGKVKIYKENPVLYEDPYSILSPGDFFGVVSCMSGHSREESAVALENTSLICVEKELFGLLIQKNPAVAMKIIRFFSRKLRQFDHAIISLTLNTAGEESPAHLFNIGEFYLKHKSTNHAIYAFQKYLQFCPNGTHKEKAMERLKTLKAAFTAADVPYRKGMTRKYPDNTMLFSEAEPGEELFIIQEGKVKITKIMKDEVLLAVLKTGDIFGEMALLDNKPRSASAISYEEVTVLAVNKSNFEGMVQAQPQLATKLIQLLSERIWTAYRQLENLMIKNKLGRIYDTLLIQIEKMKISIEPKKPYNFEFGSKELINMVGVSAAEGESLIVQLLEDKNIEIPNTPSYIEYIETQSIYKTSDRYKKDREYWETSFDSLPELAKMMPYETKSDSLDAIRKTFTLDVELCNK